MLLYSLLLFAVSLTVLIVSKSKLTDAMTEPNYDMFHTLSVVVLKKLSVISFILLVMSVILLFISINEILHFYDYG